MSISSEVGSGKQERAIFEDALAKLNCAPTDCIFIDNTAYNLIIPAEMGMATHLFDDAARDMNGLRARLQEQGL